MRIFQRADDAPGGSRGCAVAIGNFDGVHLGHQRVFAVLRAQAQALAVPAAVLTFDPHPRRLFDPGLPAFALSPTPERIDRIARHGLDFTVVQPFDHAFAAVTAEEFVVDLLVNRLGVRHVVVGDDYRFGHRRRGDVDLLRNLGRRCGFGVTAVPPFRDEQGRVCSSSRVRAALAEGRPDEASRLLGRPWEIDGPVERRRDGTLALALAERQRLLPGIYAVAAVAGDGRPPDETLRTQAWLPPPGWDGGDCVLLPGHRAALSPRLRVQVLELVAAIAA